MVQGGDYDSVIIGSLPHQRREGGGGQGGGARLYTGEARRSRSSRSRNRRKGKIVRLGIVVREGVLGVEIGGREGAVGVNIEESK